jgi:hypothetical protein
VEGTDAKDDGLAVARRSRRVAGARSRGLAWEFLRRNPEYREDFQQTLQRVATGEISEEAATMEFSRRWGVSFRPRSRLAGERESDDLARRADTVDRRSCPRARSFLRGA